MQIKNAVYIKIGCKSTISNSQKLGVDSKKCKKNDICKRKSSALKNEREMHNSRHAMPDQWTKGEGQRTGGMQCRINGRNSPKQPSPKVNSRSEATPQTRKPPKRKPQKIIAGGRFLLIYQPIPARRNFYFAVCISDRVLGVVSDNGTPFAG